MEQPVQKLRDRKHSALNHSMRKKECLELVGWGGGGGAPGGI